MKKKLIQKKIMFISMYVCIYKRLFKICQSKMVHSYLNQLLNKEK
jgi:hypothetical protein